MFGVFNSQLLFRTLKLMSLKLIRLIHLPRGLSYNQVRITSHKKNGVVQQIIHKDKRAKSYLHHLFPPTRSQAHGRSLHNKDRPSLTKLNALINKAFFRRCAFMLMACNLGTYGNLMYNLMYISSFYFFYLIYCIIFSHNCKAQSISNTI